MGKYTFFCKKCNEVKDLIKSKEEYVCRACGLVFCKVSDILSDYESHPPSECPLPCCCCLTDHLDNHFGKIRVYLSSGSGSLILFSGNFISLCEGDRWAKQFMRPWVKHNYFIGYL